MALLIEYGRVMPIGPKDVAGKCEFCSRELVGKWRVKLSGAEELWCARCFLYETEWGKKNAAERDSLINAVEAEIKQPITTQDGQLTDDGADRILVSTVMVSAYELGKRRAKDIGS